MDIFKNQFNKLAKSPGQHGRFPEASQTWCAPAAFNSDRPVRPCDVYRFRRQRGVNLGSWFTLERWITEAPFKQAVHPAQSDFDVASGAGAKEVLEAHWDTWISDDDWVWLAQHGINTVRIPIGFYHICGVDPSTLQGSDFAPFRHVFEGAWSRILRAIDVASHHGIGVLIDLHAAPGKQNADAHSGQTGPIRFFSPENMSITKRVLCALSRELKEKENVVGLQLLNEPQNRSELPEWYTSTLDAIRVLAPDLPLYIHDAWNRDQYAALAGSRTDTDFVVVDHHLYRCFTPDDHRLSGEEHACVLRDHTTDEILNVANKCRGNFVVAEFSAALNPASLRSEDPGEQDRQRRVFAAAQLELYEQVCAGWFFWTYKKDGWDAGWCLKDTVVAAIMPEWIGIKRIVGKGISFDPARRDSAKNKALENHIAYWDRYKGHYEHWRFTEGFTQGWEDAFAFFSIDLGHPGISELGFKGQWVKSRAAAYSRQKGLCSNIWEFEHGLLQGADGAKVYLTEVY